MRLPVEYVPQTTTSRRPLAVWLILLAGSLFFTVAIIGAPLALTRSNTATAFIIYEAFSHLCHQLPERSYYIAGQKFAVCARCTGIYSGFVAGVIMYPLVRSLRRIDAPDRKWLFLAALPLALDFILSFLEVWENTHTSRLLTGMILGAVAVFYVIPGLVDVAINRLWASERQVSDPVNSGRSFATAPSDYSAPHRRI